MRQLIQVLAQALSRSAAFAVGYAVLGVSLGAVGAFWGDPDPRFGDQLVFEMNLAVLAILLSLASSTFLIGTVATLFAAPRRFVRRDAGIAVGAGAGCMLITNLLFVLRLSELAPGLVGALGAAAGVLCVKRGSAVRAL